MQKIMFALFVLLLSGIAFAQYNVVKVGKDSERTENGRTDESAAVPVNETGLRFWYSASTATVEGIENKDVQEVIIPSKILYSGKEYDVTKIAVEAFAGCTSLTSIVIPNSVIKIGWSAFRDCTSLTSIEIPNSVTIIGEYAFSGCASITDIVIPNSVTDIERYAFRGCLSLTNIVIPNSVTSIEWFAFRDCTNLRTARVPKGLDISNAAFPETCRIEYY